ncbi:endonuclease [Serratia phage vB_SmaA_3M]|uniref:Putative homing endonuclease n=1 Tax=Serratia phage vB_SmaA_3M TaxID=2419930 RepID=A0A3G2YS53_9CAUD|nr:endonuclease [Serratia phage vB_SmaA_3M]AYP28319.1 putative homing endonuclease [Serratia phage vB_SmaA_3M]
MPYVYRLKSKDGHFYYGCRFAKGCHPDDLLSSYFTSSNNIKSLIAEHGVGYFTKKIVYKGSTPEEVLRVEAKLIHRTYKKPGSLNFYLCRSDGSAIFLGTYGPHKEETKAKIALSHLGRKVGEEGRRNMSISKTGIPWNQSQRDGVMRFQATERYKEVRAKINHTNQTRSKTPEEKAAISAKLTGIKRSDETKRKMSESTKASQAGIPLYKRPRALKLKNIWAMAEQCYQFWLSKKGGYWIFCRDNNSGDNISVFRSMYGMFEEGWIPSEDKEFQEHIQ